MANETLAHVKVGQLPKDADWSLTDGRSMRFAYALNDGGKADYALFDRQDRALAVLKTVIARVNPGAGGTGKVRCANA